MALPEQQSLLRAQIDVALQNLASSFRNTDATTFLSFIGKFFRQASPDVSLSSSRAIDHLLTDHLGPTKEPQVAHNCNLVHSESSRQPPKCQSKSCVHQCSGIIASIISERSTQPIIHRRTWR
jgi:hypothetical protein